MDIQLNPVQQSFSLNHLFVKKASCVWGRGTGKSSFGIGLLIVSILRWLPKSKWVIVASTYRAMLENTLPSTVRALELLGYKRDIHYIIGIRPPKNWPVAYEAPLRGYTYCISFFNGTIFQLVSQDSSATSVRGLNTDGAIVDEALLLDKEAYDKEVGATIRANRTVFNAPFHHGQFFFSSMPYGNAAEWLTDGGLYYKNYQVNPIAMQEKAAKLQLEFLKATSKKLRKEIWLEQLEIKRQVVWQLNRQGRMVEYYSESNVFDNIRHLGLDYIENHYRNTSYIPYCTEFINLRQTKPIGAFYSRFERSSHTYNGIWHKDIPAFNNSKLEELVGEQYDLSKLDGFEYDSSFDQDCLPSTKLMLGLDFGAKINSLVVCQHLEGLNRFNFLKSMWVKSPDTIDELARDFCRYYRKHPERIVELYYDRFGNQKQGNSKLTFAEQFAQVLTKEGWTVILKTKGGYDDHRSRYLLWSIMLDTSHNRDKSLPQIGVNFTNARDLVYSLEGANTTERGGDIKKDKSQEGKNIDTEERTTHLSDAADYVLFPQFKHVLKKREHRSRSILMPGSN